ncbi:MAG: PAS domain S-box protein, partial [Anaerolineae bacterium]|nr:PAS domain S-box protein [Anaerolineae bacterium]
RKSLLVELLQVVAVAANQSTNARDMLQFTLDQVCLYLNWPVGHVFILDTLVGEFVSSQVWHLDHPDEFQLFRNVTAMSRIAPSVGFIGHVANTRQPVWFTDLVESDLLTRSREANACGLRSIFAFPVLVGAEVVAVLEFYTIEVVNVDDHLLEQIARIGTQLGQVFEREQNERAFRQYTERLRTLHEIDQAILAEQTPEMIADIVLTFVQQQLNPLRSSVILFDFENQEAREVSVGGPAESHLPSGTHFSLAGFPPDMIAVLQSGAVLRIPNLALLRDTNPIVRTLEAEGLRAGVLIPLVVDGQRIGTLNLWSDTLQSFDNEKIAIASELAGQIAIAVQQARYREQIARHVAELEDRVMDRTAELQQTKNRIETILNSSSDAIILASFDGIIKQVNPAASDLFGYSGEELFGGSLFVLVASESEPDLLIAMKRVVHLLQPCVIEVIARRKDGTVFDGHLALSPILEGSVIKGIVGSLRDITERKRAEQEIRTNEAKFRALIEFAPNPIVIVDAAGQITLVNGQVKHLLGYEMEELIGQPVSILIPERFRESHAIHHARYMVAPRTRLMGEKPNLSIRHRNGSEIPVEIGLSPIHTGTELLVMTYVVDMTARRQLEESLRGALAREKELSEIRTRFISMVSHDFRTPLSIIRSSASILESYHDRLDEERKAGHFSKIQMQIDRMVALLNDVLTISQADAGKTPFNPVMLDLDQSCRNLVDEFQSMPDMKHTLVYTYSGDGQPLPAMIDEKLLQQAIINLLTNAFKYSPPGSTVYWDLSFDADNAIIRIQDSGIGIPEADQPHLFEPFHRAGNVGTTEGTGLGMAIVKRSVEAHGGTISFESQVGVGTTFTVRLPLR